jgi:lipopolysaccharide export system protein LptA
MNSRLTLACLPCLALLAGGLAAQSPAPAPEQPKKKGLIDTIKKAIDGNKDRVSDETRQKAEAAAKAAMEALPADLKDKALQMATDPKAAEMRQKAIQTVQGAMQSRETPPPAQETVAPAQAATPGPPPQVGPQPRKLQPLVLDDPQEARQAKNGRTEITATKSAYFDANTGVGIYRGNVRLRHPNAYIECEELEVHLDKDKDQASADRKKKAPNDIDILASRSEKKAAGASQPEDTEIEVAYARGSMVTIEKFDENGELQIGHCNEVAIYDDNTHSFTLRGWPSVQRGNKLLEATDPRCVIVIDQAGRLKADGGFFRTTLIDEKAAQGSPPPVTTPAAPARP